MDTFYIICGIVVAVVLLGFILLPIAKAKGLINKKIASGIAEGVDNSIDVVQAIVKAIEERGVKIKGVNAVLDIADLATDYVVELIDSDTSKEKVELSLTVIENVLSEINIFPTKSQQNLINIVVEQSVKFLVDEDKLA